MSLHNDIMNISAATLNRSLSGYNDSDIKTYKIGHRDARHAAAELALKADARIAALEEALQWYVDTDEVSEGMEGNEFWTEGKHRAQKLLKGKLK